VEYNADARVASDPDAAFNWIAGVTYVSFDQDRLQTFLGDIPLGYVVPGLPLNAPFPLDFSLGGFVKTSSWAGYVDAHYRLNDKLTLSGGLRYTIDAKTMHEFQIFNGSGASDDNKKTWSSPSGKLGLDYQASDDLLLYASLSRGFKSGAIAVGGFTDPAKPETVDNAEVGVKSNFWDDRAQLNVAAFINNYRDLQVFEVGYLSAILSNAARARISGVEVEGILKPLPDLTFDGSLGYNDATYTKFSTPDLRHGLPMVDVAGNQLPMVSKVQFHVGAEYGFPIGTDLHGSLRADYAWRDKYYFSEFNTADEEQGAYGTVDLSATLTPQAGAWQAYAFVRNLADETTINSMTVNSPLLGSSRLVNLNPPRRFGVGLRYEF
jgi:iron complex outermembrane recepter protein